MEERVVVLVAAPCHQAITADAVLDMILFHCHPYHHVVQIFGSSPGLLFVVALFIKDRKY